MTSGLVPDIYLIPSQAWIDDDQSVFVSHDYGDGMKSRLEWGLTLSGKAVQRLEASYRFEAQMQRLVGPPRQGQPEDLALAHPGADAEREHAVVARWSVLEQRADLLGGQCLQPSRRHAGRFDLVAGVGGEQPVVHGRAQDHRQHPVDGHYGRGRQLLVGEVDDEGADVAAAQAAHRLAAQHRHDVVADVAVVHRQAGPR